jgi:hypothetical protein
MMKSQEHYNPLPVCAIFYEQTFVLSTAASWSGISTSGGWNSLELAAKLAARAPFFTAVQWQRLRPLLPDVAAHSFLPNSIKV